MMAKANQETKVVDDASNWNSAKRYSDSKIMAILESIDRHEMTAQFGFSNLEDAVKNNQMEKSKLDYLKFQGFKFLVARLLQLISNSDFAIVNNKIEFKKWVKKLEIIDKSIIPTIEDDVSNGKILLPDYYVDVLSITQKIKSKLNLPLNKNNLIFMNKADYDPMEAKKRLMEESGAIPE